MAKIRFLFHKSNGPDIKKGFWRWAKAKTLSGGIIGWTWILAVARFDFKSLKFNYDHVEVWFPDENGEFGGWVGETNNQLDLLGECFSSTTRGDAKGVRFAPASEVLRHPERWDYQEFEIEDYEVKDWKEYYEDEIGKKYDYLGILGFLSLINIQDKDKWFCSELCAWVARSLSLVPEWYQRISPRRLSKVLGGEIKPL